MSLRNKEYVEVTHRVKNNFAFILEEFLFAVFPSEKLLECNLSKETVKKYKAFYNALYDEVGFIECDDASDYYIIQTGKNYIN